MIKEKQALSAATIDGFMRKLLGIPAELSFEFPSEEYAGAFAETIGEKKLPEELEWQRCQRKHIKF